MNSSVAAKLSKGTFQLVTAKGFTLIEVVLSVVVLAVGVVAVQKTFLGSLSALSVIENWDQANELLQGKIEDIEQQFRGVKVDIHGIPRHETLWSGKRSYAFDMKMRPVTADNRLFEATGEVSWEIRGIRRKIARTFYCGVPYEAWKITGL
ncbi:MAG TPA: prepilin-type N-terminal cleavage/methylation domain-containing protein [Candidatus Omnitrophota bacterium]|nr:prepilin-type N-terminal cleavage/methylation domain-containing protein [Candidatus Omnitrophota bacterium]HPS37295.1 prepilin-type N-terminal cleavage/methylation domain-containing protein [Candidatus Omnitrophota bacterium]